MPRSLVEPGEQSSEPDEPPPPESTTTSTQANTASTQTSATPPPPPAPPEQPRRGCWGQTAGALGWLFTVLFTVVLAIVAAGALAYYGLGYSWTTPTDLANARDELVAVQERNATLEARLVELQDQTDDLAGRVSSGAEAINELLPQVQALQVQATDISRLGGDLRENMAMAATIQADSRDNQAAVEALATVQANTSEQVDELSESTDRLVRFLERLSNIAEDTAGSINPSNTPTATLTPTATPTATLTPTATPTATSTEEAEGTPQPTAEGEEAEGTPQPTPTTGN